MKLKIFISYVKEDFETVSYLHKFLREQGYEPWIDRENLIPGQNWRHEIAKAIKTCDLFISCLSNNSVSKEGYFQKELKIGMDFYDEKPEGSIYLIPVRLDNCELPNRFADIQWCNLFEENGFDELLKSIRKFISTLSANKSNKIEQNQIIDDNKKFSLLQYRISEFHQNALNHTGKKTNYLDIVIGTDSDKKDPYILYSANNSSRCTVVRIMLSAYSSLKDVLDDLYVNCLANVYKPYSYGEEWILVSFRGGLEQLLVPWAWLIERYISASNSFNKSSKKEEINRSAYLFGGAIDVELVNTSILKLQKTYGNQDLFNLKEIYHSHWQIKDPSNISAVGFATSNKKIFNKIRTAKSDTIKKILSHFAYESDEYPIRKNSTIYKRVSPRDVRHFKYKIVFTDHWWWNHNSGIAIVPKNELIK